ncbi:MAG TPA: hypothetical protein VF681_03310 [Abditibacteriaceae bacterium]|jgi:uncharacterized protein (TIGR02588 family)
MKIEKNALEWSVFALSFALLVGTIGFLVLDARRTGDGAPLLEATTGRATQWQDQWLVPVRIVNRGETVAEEVAVEVKSGEESGELAFAFVPRGSSREGFVSFSKEPQGQLKARVRGYETP